MNKNENILEFLKSKPEGFSFKDGVIGGDDCVLITPNDIKCKWSEDTLKFRSMLVRKNDGEIVSRGYDKFFNFAEQPDLNKFPDGAFNVVEKKDGSLIIWGIHNNELIHRTRGTFTAKTMVNGHEIEFLKSKYPKLIEAIGNYSDCSILTEWQTKTNIIVINEVSEPTLTLVGIIHNKTGHLWHQGVLDDLAVEWGIDRPNKYHYDSISECISDVDLWEGKEGVVLYSECGQYLRKIKSCWYCELHKLATGIKGIKQVLDVFITSPRFLNYQEFYDYIETTLDFEIAEKCKDYIKEICEAYTYFSNTEIFIRTQVDVFIRSMESRRDQAMEIQQKFSGWQVTYAFLYLDGRSIDDKLLRKAMEDTLKL